MERLVKGLKVVLSFILGTVVTSAAVGLYVLVGVISWGAGVAFTIGVAISIVSLLVYDLLTTPSDKGPGT